jgi:hypothetical protein
MLEILLLRKDNLIKRGKLTALLGRHLLLFLLFEHHLRLPILDLLLLSSLPIVLEDVPLLLLPRLNVVVQFSRTLNSTQLLHLRNLLQHRLLVLTEKTALQRLGYLLTIHLHHPHKTVELVV